MSFPCWPRAPARMISGWGAGGRKPTIGASGVHLRRSGGSSSAGRSRVFCGSRCSKDAARRARGAGRRTGACDARAAGSRRSSCHRRIPSRKTSASAPRTAAAYPCPSLMRTTWTPCSQASWELHRDRPRPSSCWIKPQIKALKDTRLGPTRASTLPRACTRESTH